jgi:hypothetical protein
VLEGVDSTEYTLNALSMMTDYISLI